jgi:hypothetical protein
MTDKPKAYTITPERFARARADLDRRRAQLDAEFAQLDADEQAATDIDERYSEDAGPAPAKSVAKAKRPNTGRPYKPKEEARILDAEFGELETLAEALGRNYPGVLKHHEVLLKRRKSEETDTPAAEIEHGEEPVYLIEQPAPPENLGSKTSPVVEATAAAPTPAPPADARRTTVTRGRPVHVLDDGPEHKRIYGVGFASRQAE